MSAKRAAARGAQLPRAEVRSARGRLRAGDTEAARRLLSHSVACGHDRLALRRYFIARILGVDGLDEFEMFCGAVARSLPGDAVGAMARDAALFADRIQKAKR